MPKQIIEHIIAMSLLVFISNIASWAQSKVVNNLDSATIYIGIEYGSINEISPTIVFVNGHMLQWNGKKEYSLQTVTNSGTMMVWFERLLFRDSLGHAHFKVLDAITLPKLKENQIFIFGHCNCGFEGDNGNIFAIGVDNDPSVVDDIVYAWRANYITQKIEAIPTENVQCMNGDPAHD